MYFSNRDVWEIGRIFPTSTLVDQGIITCPWRPGINLPNDLQKFLPSGTFHGRRKHESPLLFTDQAVMGRFDHSRIPPRVASQVPHARLDIRKEITGLIKNESGQPPALIQVALKDPEYRHLWRVPITRVVKRKSVDLYKCTLCTCGDVSPLTATSLMSRPTAHRCGIEILCTLASHFHLRWRVRALGIFKHFPSPKIFDLEIEA